MCMSEKETSEISKRLDTIEKMIIQSRDMPQSETMSKLIKNINTRLDSIEAKIDPILEMYHTAGNVKKACVTISIFLVSVAGIIGSVKALFTWFSK